MHDAHPLFISYHLGMRRTILLPLTFLPISYLGERCWFQATGELRITGDPLSCDGMFGRRWNIGSQHIQGLRPADVSTFFLADGTMTATGLELLLDDICYMNTLKE